MSAPIPIPLKLTNAGRLAALDAFNSGLNIKLTHFAIGSGKYNSETTGAGRTALQNEIARYPVSGGSIEPVSRTLRFSAILESGITQNAFEVGLFDENGVLFAVASTTGNDPLILVTANIAFVASLSLVLADINVTNLSVVDDPSSPLAIALMNQHLANPDPHPQYPLKAVLASIIYPVGSWHGTNNAGYNPATALKPLFGYETTWYLWPYVPAGVANPSAALGQIVEFENGSGTQAKTTRIWERLPDGASAPTYALTASQTTVDEGEQVTFTLSTTGIAQGTAVDWNITGIQTADITPNALTGQFVVGADGTATKTITIVADQTDEGTETLKFALTYINNKFVNVTISDTSIQAEQVVTISSDQTDINLLNLFTTQYGAPTAATKAVFVVNDGVNVIASTTNKYAVTGGAWPANSTREIRVMSGAMLAGRGGDAGQCSLIAGDSNTSVSSTAPTNGQNGGTAIKAETGSPITVNNYGGLIAGGGGGGGGQGGYQYFNSGNWTASVWWMGAGGGAPYGNEFLNANTWNHMVKYYGAPELNTDAYGGNAFKWQANGDLSYYNGSGYVSVANIARPAGLSGLLSGRILGAVDANGMAYMGRPGVSWPFDRKQIRMAKPGSLKTGGQSGSCAVTETTSIPHFVNYADSQAEVDTLLSRYCGGRGGDVGENGQDAPALTPRIRPTSNSDYANMSTGEQDAYQVAVVAGAAGGLAGYVYQGPVTIINHGSGQSKGRTP